MVGSRVATVVAQLLGRITIVLKGFGRNCGRVTMHQCAFNAPGFRQCMRGARKPSAGTARAPYHASIDTHACIAGNHASSIQDMHMHAWMIS